MPIMKGRGMVEKDNVEESLKLEIEILKASMAEFEAELQALKWLLAGIVAFMVGAVWYFSSP